jgi:hypothetical protein
MELFLKTYLILNVQNKLLCMLFSFNDVSMKTKAHSYFVNIIQHSQKNKEDYYFL